MALKKYQLWVQAVESSEEVNPTWGPVSIDNESGAFKVEDISPGIAVFRIVAEGYAPTEFEAQILRGENNDATFSLAPEGIIEVHVRIDGVPSKANVWARRVDQRQLITSVYYKERRMRGTETDDVGRYSIASLASGEYVVEVDGITGENTTTFFTRQLINAVVESGKITEVHVDITGQASITGGFQFPEKYARGRVHLLHGHVPGIDTEENPFVFVNQLAASTERMRESAPFEFTHLQPGAYTLVGFAYNNKELEGEEKNADVPRIWHFIQLTDDENLAFDVELAEH